MGRIKPRDIKKKYTEQRIREALEERRQKGTNLRDLALKFKVPRSTLSDRQPGGSSRQEAQQPYQTLPVGIELALIRWVDDMQACGFPPRLDLFKAMAAQMAEEEESGKLGTTWLQGLLKRHPELSTKFATNLDRQRALSSKPDPIQDYFRKLQTLLRKHKFLPENIYNMDEKGFLLGFSNRARVIVKLGRRPPTEVQGMDSRYRNRLRELFHASTYGYLPR